MPWAVLKLTEPQMRLGIATTNADKRREFVDLLAPLGFVLEAAPPDFDVPETGATFADNALLKAQALMRTSGLAAIADDSGLVIPALDGAPGLFSARYSGETRPALRDAANRARVLRELAGVADMHRAARFVCAIALVQPQKKPRVFQASLEGRICNKARGQAGFGYDAIFVPCGQSKTMAEISHQLRYQISHRAQALRLLHLALFSDHA